MLCWMKPKCMHPVAVCATKMSFLSEWTVQYKWDERVCQSLCVRHGQQHVVCVSVCVCVCLCESDLQQRRKKNTPKNNKDDGVILWCPGEVILTPTDLNIYQTFLEKMQVQKLPMKSAQSISHFVINIIYFFNIIQHLIQIPYSWEDGWMEPPNY